MTSPHPAAPPALNLDVLRTWLDAHGLSPTGALTAERIGNGQSNLTYTVRDAANLTVVVRRPPLGTVAHTAHDVAREGRIMGSLAHTDVPVPTIYGLIPGEENSAGQGAPLLVMSKLDGQAITSPSIAQQYSPEERARIGEILVDMLVAIHRVDIDDPASDVGTLATRAPYAPRQLDRWHRQWTATKTRESAALEELTARLRRAVPHQDETVLCHGDLHLGNVMVTRSGSGVGQASGPAGGEASGPGTEQASAQGPGQANEPGTTQAIGQRAVPTVAQENENGTNHKSATGIVASGVVDWELSTLGDPLADVGSLMAYWPERGGIVLPGFEAALAEGFPTAQELADAYVERTGRSREAIHFWHVLGMWKVAIIAEGVLHRIQQNPHNRAPGFSPTVDMVDALIDAACERASAYGL